MCWWSVDRTYEILGTSELVLPYLNCTVLVYINLTLQLKKSCSAHLTMFEIVARHNVVNWIQLLT